MDITNTSVLRNTRFTEMFIQKNALDQSGFKGWAFCSGMLFNSTDKWWGDLGKRDKPHEGLDLCLYRDCEDNIFRVHETASVPAIYGGTVVGIIDDFLGKSVVIEHVSFDRDAGRLCTIYAHTIPNAHLHVGSIVRKGDVIAALADSSRFKTDIIPHLHLSVGRATKAVSYDRLDWKNIGDPDILALLDPLQIIDGNYVILARKTWEIL